MEKTLNEIHEKLKDKEILAQLQEEAAELSVAASKLRRAMDGVNPTPMSREEAMAQLLEEIADVSNCIKALSLDCPLNRMKVQGVMEEKARRWAYRVGLEVEKPCEANQTTESGEENNDG